MRVHWTREYHLQRILYFYFTILFKLDFILYLCAKKELLLVFSESRNKYILVNVLLFPVFTSRGRYWF